MSKYIIGIDPGNEESAYAFLNPDLRPLKFGKMKNQELRDRIFDLISDFRNDYGRAHELEIAIEMVASYGMPVGKSVFETCVEIGRLVEMIENWAGKKPTFIYRMEEKVTICHDSRAKDANIRQALIDRFGPVGTKKEPGWFYGVSKDVWSAIAVGVTYHDKYIWKEGRNDAKQDPEKQHM